MRLEIARLRVLARGGPLELDCYCSPLPCHGDVLRAILEEESGDER